MGSREESSITALPTEVLMNIWKQSSLTCTDICNLAKVCTTFKEVSAINEVWQSKFEQRYPILTEQLGLNSTADWRQKYLNRCFLGRQVRHKIASMSAKYYKKVIHNLSPRFEHMLTDTERQISVIDELLEIHNGTPEHMNLTEKYWAKKALYCLQSDALRVKIEEFMSKPTEKQFMEEGLLYIAQWCQPCEYIRHYDTIRLIDLHAMEVIFWMKNVYPKHPAIGLTCDTMPKELPSSLWGASECRQVINAINTVFFQSHSFRGQAVMLKYDTVTNYCIDKVVFKEANSCPIVTAIYIAVARRLGVLCKCVIPDTNDNAHTLLGWYDKNMHEPRGECFVDVCCGRTTTYPGHMPIHEFNNAHIYRVFVGRLTEIGRFNSSTSVSKLMQMCELAVLFHDYEEIRLLLGDVYVSLRTKLNEIDQLMEPVVNSPRVEVHGTANYIRHMAREHMESMKDNEKYQYDVITPIKPKRRKNGVKWKVGKIMKHVKYDYLCVVTGWDPKCEATMDWVIQMGVHNLPHQEKQPFYNVLVSDGSNRYAAQENLAPAPEPREPITHHDIGRYFCEFTGKKYIPNAVLRQKYPDDFPEANYD